MEEKEIIALFQNRSEDAIPRCRARYGRVLDAVARNILTDRRDAEECVADALLSAWNSIPPEEPDRLGAYLTRLVRNRALDMLKARTAKKRGGGEAEAAIEELSDLAGTLGDPERQTEKAELTAAIEKFLRALPADKRRTFIRRYWYMYPVKEIARAQGESVSKVKSELSRLREKLRRYLEEEGFDL